jgi:hypothetical protein
MSRAAYDRGSPKTTSIQQFSEQTTGVHAQKMGKVCRTSLENGDGHNSEVASLTDMPGPVLNSCATLQKIAEVWFE